MSSVLDLNAGTITLAADTTYTYYQITDSSITHNGVLVMAAGSILRFDNKAGAGFSSAATAIDIRITGTTAKSCAIISADPNPTYTWTMPVTTTTLDARHCEFKDYSGDTSANYWAFDDCLFAGERYCSVEDLMNATSSTLGRVPMALMVEDATRIVKSKLLLNGMVGSTGTSIQAATLNYAVVGLLTRYRMDGTKPASLSIGEFSASDTIDNMIKELKERADKLIKEYCSASHLSTQIYKVNQ